MSRIRRIAVMTTGRQDYGILRSTLLILRNAPEVDLHLIIGGMHLSPRHGLTIREIERDGFPCTTRVDWLSDELNASVPSQIGVVIVKTAEALENLRPDFLVLVGDRYETAGAAISATVSRVPIVHLHGGEETEGAFDNQLRHAITKMSHLHLVSHAKYAARVIQMGEDPATVHVVGAPGLDNFHREDLPDRSELEGSLGIRLVPPVIIVTLHPATLGESSGKEADAVIGAMRTVEATYVITLPNSDPGALEIREKFLALRTPLGRIAVTEALGARRYFGLLQISDAVLGNSSSALVEAPAMGIPTVNVGDRQKGRMRGETIIDVAGDSEKVVKALRLALSPEFHERARCTQSLFGSGSAGSAVATILRAWTPPCPPRKSFVEITRGR